MVDSASQSLRVHMQMPCLSWQRSLGDCFLISGPAEILLFVADATNARSRNCCTIGITQRNAARDPGEQLVGDRIACGCDVVGGDLITPELHGVAILASGIALRSIVSISMDTRPIILLADL